MKYPITFSRYWPCLVLILMTGCTRETEILKLHIDITSQVQQYAQKGFNFTIDYFVIKNPPGNIERLQALVDSFDGLEQFLPRDSKDYQYERVFYKETKSTPRTYKEGQDLGFVGGKDDIINHSEDRLVDITWSSSDCIYGISYKFYKKGKILEGACKDILNRKDCEKENQRSATAAAK
jgi:hypothetical protein